MARAHYHPSKLQVDITLPTQTRYLRLIGNLGEELAQELEFYNGDKDELGYNLNLVLTEAMTNAIKYASAKTKKVRITIRVRLEELCIRVYDNGNGFDLNAIPNPDLDNPSAGGLGIFFIKTVMDSARYYKAESSNILEMRKRLNS